MGSLCCHIQFHIFLCCRKGSVAHSFIALIGVRGIHTKLEWQCQSVLCEGKRNNGNHSETGEFDGGYAPDPIRRLLCIFVHLSMMGLVQTEYCTKLYLHGPRGLIAEMDDSVLWHEQIVVLSLFGWTKSCHCWFLLRLD